MKICSKCGIEKPKEAFRLHKDGRDGRQASCKACDAEMHRKWRIRNKDRVNARNAAIRRADPQKAAGYVKRWRESNPERNKFLMRRWAAENPEKVREHGRKTAAKRAKKPLSHVQLTMSHAVRSHLNGGKARKKTFDILGYTVEELMAHLESKFSPGMTWDNYGRGGWHIDHIIPISVFNFKTYKDMDFKRCWALDNLQPLWAKDNLAKQAKLKKPFQPCFAIEDFA